MSAMLLENLAVMHMIVDVIEVGVVVMRRLLTPLLLWKTQVNVT